MTIPPQSPVQNPGPARLAIVTGPPSIEEETWRVCPSGHTYAGQFHGRGGLITQRNCPACSSPLWEGRPTPLVGQHGRMVDDALQRAGWHRGRCWLGSEDLLVILTPDLAAFEPACVLLLGDEAFHIAHPDGSLDDWRGSIFEWRGHKCVATYHPAETLRQGDRLALLRADVDRAVKEAQRGPALDLPVYEFDPDPSVRDLVAGLEGLRACRTTPLGFDLEGYAAVGMTDCSFALTPRQAIWVPFVRASGLRWWSPADEQRIWTALRALLEDPFVLKVAHNGLYEWFLLAWAHRISLRGLSGDTMLKWHEAAAEMDKALEVAASLLTRQPYWKHGRGAVTDAERALYNVTDSCVTLEIDGAMDPLLTPGQRAHYEFNVSLLPAMADQMLRGIRFDVAGRAALASEIQAETLTLQGELDALAGITTPTLEEVARRVCMAVKVRKGLVQTWDDVQVCAKPTFRKEHVA
jgi:hypothetical protein